MCVNICLILFVIKQFSEKHRWLQWNISKSFELWKSILWAICISSGWSPETVSGENITELLQVRGAVHNYGFIWLHRDWHAGHDALDVECPVKALKYQKETQKKDVFQIYILDQTMGEIHNTTTILLWLNLTLLFFFLVSKDWKQIMTLISVVLFYWQP